MSSSSAWRSEGSSWRGRAPTSTGPRSAAWEKKWKDFEADLQDAVLKLPEGLPAMPTVLGQPDVKSLQSQACEDQADAEEHALQSITRFVATDLPLTRSHHYTPKDPPRHAQPLMVGTHQEVSESESTAHSKTSSDTGSTTSAQRMRSQSAPPVTDKAYEELDPQAASESLNVQVDVKHFWECEGKAENFSSRPSRTSTTSEVRSQVASLEVDKKPKFVSVDTVGTLETRETRTSGRLQLSVKEQNPWNRIRFVRHLWLALVGASFVELCLFSSCLLADNFSPCRAKLETCRHLHDMDCWGTSCRESAPPWAFAWPAAGLIFLAAPLKCFLRSNFKEVRCTHAGPFVLLLTSFAAALFAVVGAGTVVLVESASSAMHYADRCPMRRESSRCTAELCPSPPCRRESDFSPCLCGPLGEAELARALFLQGTPACQPYEWYTWQMKLLEELMLQYEEFACIVGPLACVATAVGGALLLVQLMCCPFVLVGQWGGHAAMCVLLGQLDLEDGSVPSVPKGVSPELLQLKKKAGDLNSTSSSSVILNSEMGRSGDEASVASAASDQDSSLGRGDFIPRHDAETFSVDLSR